MNTYLALSIIGVGFFSIALAILITLFGIPKSLSESFYNLGGKKGKGYLFYLMLVITVFLLIAPLVEAAQYWGFLTAVSLAFVGAAAAFKDDKVQKIVHITSAALSGVCAGFTLYTMHELLMLIPVIIVIVIAAILTKTWKKSLTFWIEMIPMYSVFAGLIAYFL